MPWAHLMTDCFRTSGWGGGMKCQYRQTPIITGGSLDSWRLPMPVLGWTGPDFSRKAHLVYADVGGTLHSQSILFWWACEGRGLSRFDERGKVSSQCVCWCEIPWRSVAEISHHDGNLPSSCQPVLLASHSQRTERKTRNDDSQGNVDRASAWRSHGPKLCQIHKCGGKSLY